jgi:hypothetical protein
MTPILKGKTMKEIKARLFNVFTIKAIVLAIGTLFSVQIPWDALFMQYQETAATVAAGGMLKSAIAVIGFGSAVANLIRKHPSGPSL